MALLGATFAAVLIGWSQMLRLSQAGTVCCWSQMSRDLSGCPALMSLLVVVYVGVFCGGPDPMALLDIYLVGAFGSGPAAMVPIGIVLVETFHVAGPSQRSFISAGGSVWTSRFSQTPFEIYMEQPCFHSFC